MELGENGQKFFSEEKDKDVTLKWPDRDLTNVAISILGKLDHLKRYDRVDRAAKNVCLIKIHCS